MGETGRPGRNPRQGVTAKAMKPKPVKKPGGQQRERWQGENRGSRRPARTR